MSKQADPCRSNQAMSSRSNRSSFDLVVVGGGMAGLTASAYAAREGLRVLLCEKERDVGGLVRSFDRNGFTWDAGIRALEDSGIIFPMLQDLGVIVDFVKSPVSLGIEDQVIPIESIGHLEDYRQLLVDFFPGREKDIERILATVKRVMKHMDVLYGIENPAFKSIRTDRAYLRKLLPWLARFLVTIGRINSMTMPVDEHLQTLTDSQTLIDMISQHFFRKTPAFFALSYFSLYLDYVYPIGGTGALPNALESFCLEHGVDIRRETRITGVDPIAHTVAEESGAVHAYRQLLWAADIRSLYRRVRIDDLPGRRRRARAADHAALVERAKGGDSVFTLYLAVDLEPEWFAAKSNGHLFYTPSREGVGGSIYSDLDDILAIDAREAPALFRARATEWIQRYLQATTYEISIPVLKDASLAPKDKTGLIVSVLFDHALCERARQGGWYEELKTFAEDCLIRSLDTSIYPGLRTAAIDRFSSTPLSIAEAVGSSEGAITGWAFTNQTIPAARKMQHIARSVVTPFPDVTQAGQWSFSPSGLPIAVLTGKLAADRVTRKLRRSRRKRTGWTDA